MLRRSDGFTLIELLVTISVIGLLISILMPALGAARHSARTMQCLSNMRSMQIAHWTYMTDHDDRVIDVGLGGGGHDAANSWISTLARYYGSELLHRSPVDDSRYWSTQAPSGDFRVSSYGINNYLSPSGGVPNRVTQLAHVRRPSSTVHFLYMSESSPTYAVVDHPHAEQWPATAPLYPDAGIAGAAAQQLETHAHGGPAASWSSVSNYGFLDGHAGTLRFSEVYAADGSWNKFDPTVAY